MKTMFKLITDKGTISTAEFRSFDDDQEKGRAMAEKYILHQQERWGSQAMFAGESLRIVEE